MRVPAVMTPRVFREPLERSCPLPQADPGRQHGVGLGKIRCPPDDGVDPLTAVSQLAGDLPGRYVVLGHRSILQNRCHRATILGLTGSEFLNWSALFGPTLEARKVFVRRRIIKILAYFDGLPSRASQLPPNSVPLPIVIAEA